MASQPTGNELQDLQPLVDVLRAVSSGDFSRKLPEGQPGAMGEIARNVNTMVDQLNLFACELTRITREIGSEGRFGGQMEVPGAERAWQDLTDNVNFAAANLTNQVRNFVQVTRAYADGDFTRRATVGCTGEVQELREALNRLGESRQAGPGGDES